MLAELLEPERVRVGVTASDKDAALLAIASLLTLPENRVNAEAVYEVLLERDGYDRVDVVDRNGPRYRAEACKGLSRMRMVISPWGDRLAERRIGD